MEESLVSIHLMFLLITYDIYEYFGGKSFNTSHVSINLLFPGICPLKLFEFQYISCFY